MRPEINVKSDSAVYSKIEASHMSEHQRQLSLDAAHHADLVTDGIVWTMNQLEHLGEQLFGKAPVKH